MASLSSNPHRLQPAVHQDASTEDFFDTAELPKVAKWATAGFGALTGLLTFFGIKNQMLSRVLNEDRTPALWVIVMIGAGVVVSAIGLGLKGTVRAQAWMLVVAITVVLGLTMQFLDNDWNDNAWAGWAARGTGIALVGLALLAYGRRWLMPAAIALILLATTCTSAGLYTAAKLSITANGSNESLNVRAVLATSGDDPGLKITLKGAKQRDGQVVVYGYREPPEKLPSSIDSGAIGKDSNAVRLWRTAFYASNSRTVNETYTLPIQGRDWAVIQVSSCVLSADEADVDKASCTPTEQTVFTGGRALATPVPVGTLALRPGGKRITAKATATGLRTGEYLRVWLRREGSRKARAMVKTAQQTAAPDTNGAVAWAGTYTTSSGVRWRLIVARCTINKPCRATTGTTVARL